MQIPSQTCYVVTFEIGQSTTIGGLVEQLKTYGGYCPIHANAWAITTEKTALQICQHLMAHIGPADRIFVVRSGTQAAWNSAYSEGHTEWLKKNL